MAYTPHTWNNEVITDALLNALEAGVVDASKLSGTDIDTDLDMSGNDITNANLISVVKLKTAAWSMIADLSKTSPCHESLDSVSTISPSWDTLKTGPSVPIDRSGVVDVSYTLTAYTSEDLNATATAYGQVLKNGVAITGSESSISSQYNHNDQSVTTETCVEVGPGDVITVQAYVTHTGVSGTAYISGFGVYAHLQPILDGTILW